MSSSAAGPNPLRCYGDNYNRSFYRFLENLFMGFQFPNLTIFLSLMPNSRQHQVCVLQQNREAEESLTAVTCDASFLSS